MNITKPEILLLFVAFSTGFANFPRDVECMCYVATLETTVILMSRQKLDALDPCVMSLK